MSYNKLTQPMNETELVLIAYVVQFTNCNGCSLIKLKILVWLRCNKSG